MSEIHVFQMQTPELQTKLDYSPNHNQLRRLLAKENGV